MKARFGTGTQCLFLRAPDRIAVPVCECHRSPNRFRELAGRGHRHDDWLPQPKSARGSHQHATLRANGQLMGAMIDLNPRACGTHIAMNSVARSSL